MRVATAIAISLLLWGCGGDLLADRAAEARELWWELYPEHRTISPEQWRAEVTAEVDLTSDDELREYAETYGRLGFFPVDLDLRPILVDTLWTLYGGNPAPAQAAASGLADDGDPVFIERRDHRVVVIKNLAEELVAPLADAAFATPTRRRPARSRPSLAARMAR